MGKLSNMKEWLTVADAARHLSIVLSEDVTEADVLRLALDRQLRLSVYIVGTTIARCGRITGEAIGQILDGGKTPREDLIFVESSIDVVKIGEEIQIYGVWELPMEDGDGNLVAENQWLEQIGGTNVRREFHHGVVLEKEGQYCRLQESLDCLPKNSFFVVRTEALREFERSINDAPASIEKPMATSERNSLLTIIAALCHDSAIKPQERGSASQIANLTEEIGAPVSDDTVRRVLAKIPDALETRMK